MSINDLATLFRSAADAVDSNLPDIVVRAASDGIALIGKYFCRGFPCSQNGSAEGKNADGQAHKPYSAGYLAFKKNPQNYKSGKALGLGSSRYTGVVDYTLTTELWSDVKVISQEFSSNEYKVVVGPSKQINIDKLTSLGKRDGQTLRLSKDEVQRVKENIEIELEELLKPFFE